MTPILVQPKPDKMSEDEFYAMGASPAAVMLGRLDGLLTRPKPKQITSDRAAFRAMYPASR